MEPQVGSPSPQLSHLWHLGVSGKRGEEVLLETPLLTAVTRQLSALCSQSPMMLPAGDGGCWSAWGRATGAQGASRGAKKGWGAGSGTPRGLSWGHIKQTGLCPLLATLSRRNESCVKRDTNLFGQLIHHCKLPLFLGGLPLQGLQRALLMWAEKAPGVREDLIPLCRK